MLYLVGVQLQGALLVGFGYFVVVGGGLEVEEVVEGYFGAFREGDLVAKAEDFLVCEGRLAGANWMARMGIMESERAVPSLLHAATKVTAQATTEKARESFMMAGLDRTSPSVRGGEVVWCGQLRDLVVSAVMWHLRWRLKIGQRRGH